MAWFLDRLRSKELLTSTELYDKIGFKTVVGVSIQGRKAIAGPVCAVAVILEPHHQTQYLQSAKELTVGECREISAGIKRSASFVSIGWGIVEEFHKGPDRPVLRSLSECLSEFSVYRPVTAIVIDGFSYTSQTLPNNLSRSYIPIIRADGASEFFEPCIAASIIAKNARGALMDVLHDEFPEYGWASNKGFATKQHLEAIKTYGLSGHHRPQKGKFFQITELDIEGQATCT
jgi:ribonuclease HII